jgi:hypothetical protein
VYLSKRINSAANSAQSWKELNKVLHPNMSAVTKGLSENPTGFCENLCKFFAEKITKLHNLNVTFLTGLGQMLDPFTHDQVHSQPMLTTFTPVTPAEAAKLFSMTRIKLSSADSFPSSIIKACHGSFSIIISNLANLSFNQGRFPSRYKTAIVTPILKKPKLNPDDLSSYRPISNLNTISKILERLALTRLSPHIISSSNFNPLQSAYRKHHSTETCLLKTLSDVYSAIDNGSSALIVALDLSAAFDTVCHNTLLSRLQHMFGLSDLPLLWISSYLSDRMQVVSAAGKTSSVSVLSSGVPQGSVLGPLLFTSYTSPVVHLVSSFGLCHQQYADDTQVYVTLAKNDPHTALNNLDLCLSTLRSWYAQNGLTINPSKSEALTMSTKQRMKQLSTTGLTSVSVAGDNVPLAKSITTLGLTIDNSLTFSKHVQSTVRSSMYHIRALRHIRHLLTQKDANTVASSLIHSKLDYLNSVLYNTSATNINSLQHIENAAARVVLSAPYRTSTSKMLSTLHWLPIPYRINYKIACLVHSALTLKQPAYLLSFLKPYIPPRSLRSTEQQLLIKPRTKLKLCDQSFAVAGPSIWNELPLDLRLTTNPETFRQKLKTHLFAHAFVT